jgi:hypothetical protein
MGVIVSCIELYIDMVRGMRIIKGSIEMLRGLEEKYDGK